MYHISLLRARIQWYTSHMEYPVRKPNRLKAYDYSTPGAYYITICTGGRRCYLSTIPVGAIHESPAQRVILTRAGKIVETVIESLPNRFEDVCIDKYVIMPNHVHLLLRIDNERAIRESPLRIEKQQGDMKRSMLSKVIGYLKMNTSKQIHVFAPDLVVWQRSYYDHVIRDERDYSETWAYMDGNPGRWAEDELFAQ